MIKPPLAVNREVTALLAAPLTAGDTMLSHEEFKRTVAIARLVLEQERLKPRSVHCDHSDGTTSWRIEHEDAMHSLYIIGTPEQFRAFGEAIIAASMNQVEVTK